VAFNSLCITWYVLYGVHCTVLYTPHQFTWSSIVLECVHCSLCVCVCVSYHTVLWVYSMWLSTHPSQLVPYDVRSHSTITVFTYEILSRNSLVVTKSFLSRLIECKSICLPFKIHASIGLPFKIHAACVYFVHVWRYSTLMLKYFSRYLLTNSL
jgi:hypothetical protein